MGTFTENSYSGSAVGRKSPCSEMANVAGERRTILRDPLLRKGVSEIKRVLHAICCKPEIHEQDYATIEDRDRIQTSWSRILHLTGHYKAGLLLKLPQKKGKQPATKQSESVSDQRVNRSSSAYCSFASSFLFTRGLHAPANDRKREDRAGRGADI